MLGLDLVRPLEESWRETLDEVARRHGWPTSRDVAALAAHVAELSRAYNDPSVARAGASHAGAARLGFSFARDVPKGAAAVRELAAAGLLRPERLGSALRILDVGAGMGATTWGVVRALAARARSRGEAREDAGGAVAVEATWIDGDGRALDLGMEVVRARGEADGVALRARAIVGAVRGAQGLPLGSAGLHDLVLVGQLLSELDVAEAPETRVLRHADLLAALLADHVDEHGTLVVVEPALRDRTRHLHAVRDQLLAEDAARAARAKSPARLSVFAPCLHASPCPALAAPSDWCHEDVRVDLPRWLVPVARSAGLRHEGLTFSYLVLRKDGARLGGLMGAPPHAARLRVVSELIRTKGKREAFVCGAAREGDGERAVRARAVRLDRDKRCSNASWDDVARGELVVIEPSPTATGSDRSYRIEDGSGVRVVQMGVLETS